MFAASTEPGPATPDHSRGAREEAERSEFALRVLKAQLENLFNNRSTADLEVSLRGGLEIAATEYGWHYIVPGHGELARVPVNADNLFALSAGTALSAATDRARVVIKQRRAEELSRR